MRKKFSSLTSVYLMTIFTAGIAYYTYGEYRATGSITTAHGQQATGSWALYISYGLLACSCILGLFSLYETFRALTSPRKKQQ